MFKNPTILVWRALTSNPGQGLGIFPLSMEVSIWCVIPRSSTEIAVISGRYSTVSETFISFAFTFKQKKD